MQSVCLSLLLVASTSTTSPSIFSDEAVPDLFSDEQVAGQEPPGGAETEFIPRIRVAIELKGAGSVDTAFDRAGENVFELIVDGGLRLDSDVTDNLAVFVKPSFQHVTAFDRGGNDREFVYLEVPQAHVTWSFGRTYLRLGTQIFNWGSSDFSAPADILNPLDLRRGAVSSSSPEQSKIPVLAAELVSGLGPLTLRGVVQPFFTGSRFFLSGWDDALTTAAQAMNGPALPDISMLLGESTADRIGDQIVITKRPEDRPDNATVGARATLQLGDLDLSATGVYGWEALPKIRIDPSLSQLLAALGPSLLTGQPINPTDPNVLAAFGALQEAQREGKILFEGTYERRALVGIDGVWAVDPFILKFDVAYTFERTLYTQAFKPVSRPWLNAAVGFEYVYGDELQVMVEAFAMTVFDVRSNERIQIIEPMAPPPSVIDEKDRTIAFPGVIGVARYNVLEGDLSFETAVVSTLTRGDIFIAPTVRYRLSDQHQLNVSALFIEGKSDGYGGYYDHNDRVLAGYSFSYAP